MSVTVTFEFTGLATLAQKSVTTPSPIVRSMEALSVLFPTSRYGGVVHRPWLMIDADYLADGELFDHVIDVYNPIAAPELQHTQYALWDVTGYDLTLRGAPTAGITGAVLSALPGEAPTNPDNPADWYPLNWIVDLGKANPAKVSPKSDTVAASPSNALLAGRLSLSHGGVLRGLPPSYRARAKKWKFETAPGMPIYGPQVFTDSFEVAMDLPPGQVIIDCNPITSTTRKKSISFDKNATDVRFKVVNLDDQKVGSGGVVDHFKGHYDLTDGGSLLPTGLPGVDPVFCFVALTEF